MNIETFLTDVIYNAIAQEMDFLGEVGEGSIWWEVKMQVVRVCCALLKYAAHADEDFYAQQCDIVGRVLASGENMILRILGISTPSTPSFLFSPFVSFPPFFFASAAAPPPFLFPFIFYLFLFILYLNRQHGTSITSP